MNIFYLLFTTLSFKNFIINLILGIIFIEIFLIFFQKIFKMQFSTKNNLIYLFTNTFGLIVGSLFQNYIFSYCFMLIVTIVFLLCQLKLSSLKVLSFISLLSMLILNIQFGIFKVFCILTPCSSYIEMIESPICNSVLIILMSILGLIIYLGLQHFNLDPFLVHSISEHSNLITTLFTLNLLIVNLIFFRFFEMFHQNVLYILILDLYFYFSLEIMIHLCYSNYMKQKINNLKLCNKTILSMYDYTRAFKHDFHNIIQALGGYIITNDMKGLKNYYSQISKDCVTSNNLAKLNPELVNNPAIYNILADKYHLASSHNIQINLDVMLDLNCLNMNIYELTRVLGILLDNAIEASKECHKKNINIAFKQDQQKQVLLIENTYNNKQVCIDKIFEKDFTTKPHNTGLGLWEVKKILRKNSNLNLHTSKNNDYFSQQLEIYSA